MKGFAARLPHHLKKNNKPHWHIDYFLREAAITGILVFESDVKEECGIAQTLLSQTQCIPGFGCSDCRCKSHLVFLDKETGMEHKIARALDKKVIFTLRGAGSKPGWTILS
jgi:Uri superfamily endonuclease